VTGWGWTTGVQIPGRGREKIYLFATTSNGYRGLFLLK